MQLRQLQGMVFEVKPTSARFLEPPLSRADKELAAWALSPLCSPVCNNSHILHNVASMTRSSIEGLKACINSWLALLQGALLRSDSQDHLLHAGAGERVQHRSYDAVSCLQSDSSLLDIDRGLGIQKKACAS